MFHRLKLLGEYMSVVISDSGYYWDSVQQAFQSQSELSYYTGNKKK